MPHPTEGALRRLLDEPSAIADDDREHVPACERCLGVLTTMRAEAAAVRDALAPADAPDLAEADVAAAWERLSTAAPAPGRARVTSRGRNVRALLRRPAAAGVAFALVLAGAGAAAAGDWLPIFRTEKLAPVSFTTADLVALPDLSGYGQLSVTSQPDVHEVPDATAAAAETGLDVPEVADLPRGVQGRPVYQVGGKVTASFTFSSARAAETAARAGLSLPPPPPGLDGSSVRLTAGPGVAQLWTSAVGAPALVVGRVVAPSAYSSGVAFEMVRDYLLSLPGLPQEVAAQLRAFAADGSTLPLPVPADRATTRSDTVQGAPATVVSTRDGALAAVVWVSGGVVTVVAGSMDTDEVLDVARELR